MKAGQLDRRVIVQQRAAADPAYGAVSATWTTFATVWAGIHELTGREYLAARTQEAAQTVQVTIRYLPGLNASMRIIDNTRILQINGISMQGRKAWHVLQCTEFNQTAMA